MSDFKPIRLNKAQSKRVWDTRVGYGIAIYKTGEHSITQFEFFVDRKNTMRYIASGRPVAFEVEYDSDGFEVRTRHTETGDAWLDFMECN